MRTQNESKNMKKTFISLVSVLCFSSFVFCADLMSATEHYNRGREKQRCFQYLEAIEEYQESLAKNPNYSVVWFSLAECNYEMNEYDYALECLENAEKNMKNNIDILRLKGFCYIGLGRTKEAYQAFETILSTNPNDIESMFGLANLKILEGSYSSAESYYLEALTRQSSNKKALLSLALVSLQLGKKEQAMDFMNKAIKFHSEESQVYYFASYIKLQSGDLQDAEKNIRIAISLDENDENSNALLSYILYQQGKFSKALEVCNKRIDINRNNSLAWYLRALCSYKLKKKDDAVKDLETALKINPQDEVARSAAEYILCKDYPVEEPMRLPYADYHAESAREAVERFNTNLALSEYIRTLKLNPYDNEVRLLYADWLLDFGYPEYSLEQLKFIKDQGKSDKVLDERIESYDSYLGETLGQKWNVNPLLLEKNRVSIGFYYYRDEYSILHADSTQFVAHLLKDAFDAYPYFNISFNEKSMNSYSEIFKDARNNKYDYFAVVHFDETERENSIGVELYSTKTGISCQKWTCYRTGNKKLQAAIQKICESIISNFEIRGKIIDRKANDVLVDLGSRDGVTKDSQFLVVKKGAIKLADTKTTFVHEKENELGTVTISELSEDLCAGRFRQFGYYDRMNIGDEVVIILKEDADKRHSEFNPNELIQPDMTSEFSQLLNSIR